MLRTTRGLVSLLGVLFLVVVVGLACAKSEEKAAAPTPTPAAAPQAAAPAPAATPAPAAPAAAPAPSQVQPAAPAAAPAVRAMVPGGPVVDTTKMYGQKGVKILKDYDVKKLSVWTKASYGGEWRVPSGPWNSRRYTDPNLVHLSRPSFSGMLLLLDMGRCSMIGRDGKFNTCEGQFAKNNTTAIIPGVFEKWTQPDPLTYVFSVRKGVLWPAVPPMARPDREVTAQDIVWLLEYVKKDNILRDNFTLTKTMEAVDKHTVKVTMQQPHADFLLNIGHTSMGVFPKECMNAEGKFDCLGVRWVSPGPFILRQDVVRERGIFERNPEFYLRGLPYVDRLVFPTISDPVAVQAAFVTGATDEYISSSVKEMEQLKQKVPGLQVEAQTVNGGLVAWRMKFGGPLADVRVRRALAMTMDHATMWEVSKDGFDFFPMLVAKNFFGEDFYGYLELGGEYYQFNPDRAKKLMAEAGYPNGFTVSFSNSSTIYNEQFLHIQAQWKKYLGVDLKYRVTDAVALLDSFNSGSWEGFTNAPGGWNGTYWPDGDTPFLQMVKGARQNPEKIDDPVINDLYVKQRGELDPAKRVALLWQFEQYEVTQLNAMRLGTTTFFMLVQPWEMNGASHAVAFFHYLNGPSWTAMEDTTRQPKR